MKKVPIITLLLLSFLLATCLPLGAVTPEYRALWIDGWHNGMWTQAEIDTMIDLAYNHGHYNVLVPQVRKKGDALLNSTYGGPSGTGEPKPSQVSPSTFDPLAYMIQEAHARGMEVHPWICTHRVASLTTDWFYTSHGDWLTKNAAGTLINSEGFYLDPGVPDGEEYTVNYILDLVKNYDIDGIQYDRIRYPQQDSGFSTIATDRFVAEYGFYPTATHATFSDWRRRQLNNFVARSYAQIMEVKPWIKVGANTFATYSDAYGSRFQDWDAWMSNKWLDINQPMNYTSDTTTFDNRLKDALNRRYGRYVYDGFSLGSTGHATGVTEISHTRTWNAGYGIPWGSQTYSYYHATVTYPGWFDYVSATTSRPYYYAAALPAPMPWKSNPTTGIILGRVTDASHPGDPIYHDWIYNATVTLTSAGISRSTVTDGTGYFVFTEVTPKLASAGYQITCSKSGFQSQTYSSQAIAAGQVLRADFELGTNSTHTVTSPAGSVGPGWNIVSLPYQPVDAAPASVLAGANISNRLFRWDNPTQSQEKYDSGDPTSFGDMRVEDGYVLTLSAPYNISYTGYRGNPNRNIPLPTTGFAIIGCPMDMEANWEDVMVTKGTEMVTLREAAKTRNWLSSVAFWWSSADQSQYDIGLPEDNCGTTSMLPWHAYELYTFTNDLTLQIRQPAPN